MDTVSPLIGNGGFGALMASWDGLDGGGWGTLEDRRRGGTESGSLDCFKSDNSNNNTKKKQYEDGFHVLTQ